MGQPAPRRYSVSVNPSFIFAIRSAGLSISKSFRVIVLPLAATLFDGFSVPST
jgi:hypothetical protein